MIIHLSKDNIVQYWDLIKFGALKVNQTEQPEEFSRNLLINLLSEKTQCWLAISEDRKIKAMSLTRIFRDVGDAPHLFVETVFGFEPTTVEEKHDWLESLKTFAKNIGCKSVTTLTSNDLASNAAEKSGLKQTHKVYSVQIGGNHGR